MATFSFRSATTTTDRKRASDRDGTRHRTPRVRTPRVPAALSGGLYGVRGRVHGEDAGARDVDRLVEHVQDDRTRVQRISQLSFLDLYEKGANIGKAPAIWCPECETAISQVETEDDERHSHFNDIAFDVVSDGTDRDEFVISTTRPELIPACVSVFVHPDDEANQDLVGETARIPIFGHEVPIIEDERVDMGSGIVMCCTFGDQNDIEWYQAHDLPLRVAIDETATMTDLAGDYEGLSTEEAREAIVEDLDEEGYLRDRWDITHAVGVHERCDTPSSTASPSSGTSKFWTTKRSTSRPAGRWTGSREDVHALSPLDRGPRVGLAHLPPARFGDSVPGLVLRGVRSPDYGRQGGPASRSTLGRAAGRRLPRVWPRRVRTRGGRLRHLGNLLADSLINAGWDWDADAEEFTMENPELYPFDLRPQGHDIISFWLFHTIVKCYEHTGEVPFDATLINGHVLDENREKMSKSRGNVVAPDEVLAEYPSTPSASGRRVRRSATTFPTRRKTSAPARNSCANSGTPRNSSTRSHLPIPTSPTNSSRSIVGCSPNSTTPFPNSPPSSMPTSSPKLATACGRSSGTPSVTTT